jgi:hypothetical protein
VRRSTDEILDTRCKTGLRHLAPHPSFSYRPLLWGYGGSGEVGALVESGQGVTISRTTSVTVVRCTIASRRLF